jgi:hypothetical protein
MLYCVYSGEHCSKATKDARNINMRYVEDEDDKKDLIGRKIDLVIQGSQTEISSSEWKKKDTTSIVLRFDPSSFRYL